MRLNICIIFENHIFTGSNQGTQTTEFQKLVKKQLQHVRNRTAYLHMLHHLRKNILRSIKPGKQKTMLII
jgi:hypothetical protein